MLTCNSENEAVLFVNLEQNLKGKKLKSIKIKNLTSPI
jgi:hypothetical protein